MTAGKEMDNYLDKLIFEKSRHGRRAFAQAPVVAAGIDIPEQFLRSDRPNLPEASELQTVRHFTRLSQKNFSIDTQFYPLGSCTMKYNPKVCNRLAMLPEFLERHPEYTEGLRAFFAANILDGDQSSMLIGSGYIVPRRCNWLATNFHLQIDQCLGFLHQVQMLHHNNQSLLG